MIPNNIESFENNRNHRRSTGFEQFRSSHSEVFLEKHVLKICAKFTGEQPCRSVISILVAKQLTLRYTLVQVFSCKFSAYFQNTFSLEHLWWAASYGFSALLIVISVSGFYNHHPHHYHALQGYFHLGDLLLTHSYPMHPFSSP